MQNWQGQHCNIMAHSSVVILKGMLKIWPKKNRGLEVTSWNDPFRVQSWWLTKYKSES